MLGDSHDGVSSSLNLCLYTSLHLTISSLAKTISSVTIDDGGTHVVIWERP